MPNTSNGVDTPNSELEGYPLANILKDIENPTLLSILFVLYHLLCVILIYNSICYNNFYIFVPEFNLSNLMEELNRIKVALVQNMVDLKSRSFDFITIALYQ